MLKTITLSMVLALLTISMAQSQTITWQAAQNPHVINGTYVVPVGTTLILEPGVQVQINADSELRVEGRLRGQGTAASRITITGANNYSAVLGVPGTLELNFTDVRAKTAARANGSLLFEDCRFSGFGNILGDELVRPDGYAPYLQFDRCTFLGDGTIFSPLLYIYDCTVALRNTAFQNGSTAILNSAYLYVDNVLSDHSAGAGLSLGSDGVLFLDNLTIANADGAGLRLMGDTRNGGSHFLGPNVTLTNNLYPVQLDVAGLFPGSTVPATGNANNLIRITGGINALWPDLGIPYLVDGEVGVASGTRILPGATLKMAPYSLITMPWDGSLFAIGRPDRPIRFERYDPNQSWFNIGTRFSRLRWCIVDGSELGAGGGNQDIGAQVGYSVFEDCLFRNNGIGTGGGPFVFSSLYQNNGVGHNAVIYVASVPAENRGSLNGGPLRPNAFEGNTLAVAVPFGGDFDARNSWWNSPTGPRTVDNPGGTGDPVDDGRFLRYRPFLTAPPIRSDYAPIVTLRRPSPVLLPGTKVTLRWESEDDNAIVAHKVLYSQSWHDPNAFELVATLPGTQKTYEWTVPVVTFNPFVGDAFIRIVAVDDSGRESFDEARFVLPTQNDIEGEIIFNITPGQVFRPGQYSSTPLATKSGIDPYMTEVDGYLIVEGGEWRKLRGNFGMPSVSTDTARLAIAYGDTTNHRKYWFSPLFQIRPDPRIGDAPPAITMTSPSAGQEFAPGGVVPITWTASDDEGLRGFDIIASYDAGQTWQPIVKDLPAESRSYDWQTAPGTGFEEVRLLVIARDLRFQTTSDGASQVFSLTSQAGVSVSGVITLQESANMAEPITFVFRPVNGDPAFSRTIVLGADGSFLLENIPAREYQVRIKGVKWLAKVCPVNASSGNVANLQETLLGGDANDDNTVDVLDLDLLIQAFDSVPGALNWNENADFNCDGSVDVLDLDLLIRNFDLQGDP